MKKGTLNIYLVDLPSEANSKGNNQSNRVHFYNRVKALSVVDVFLLREAFHNQTRLMMLNSTFKGKFGLTNPSTFDNVLSLRSRKYYPSVILLQRIHLMSHSLLPFRFPLCISIRFNIISIKNLSHQRNTSLSPVTMSLSV